MGLPLQPVPQVSMQGDLLLLKLRILVFLITENIYIQAGHTRRIQIGQCSKHR